ncbi:hypothetical protein C8F01DRAFT_1076723 [Mycena amicta]|nr:hypothetical protein C8F01DRAFT_1076723 [Mycena amicta]
MKNSANLETPPRARRTSIISVFQTPASKKPTASSKHQRTPYERPRDRLAALFRGNNPKNERQSTRPPTPIPGHATDADSDDEYYEEDDSNTLSAMGDISMSVPFYVPGANGADILSSPVSSLRGHPAPAPPSTTNELSRPHRPLPPARRMTLGYQSSSFMTGWHESRPDTPSSMTSEETVRPTARSETPASISSEVTIRPTSTSVAMRTASRYKFATQSSMASFGTFSSIGTIPDESDYEGSNRQSRFEAFMQSRDLTHSPSKKNADITHTGSQRQRLEAFAREASSAVGHQIAGRPLRGNAPLPVRPPLPHWGTSDRF